MTEPTEREKKLQKKIDEVLIVLEQMHQDPKFCRGYRVGECQESDCWVWKLVMLLKAP